MLPLFLLAFASAEAPVSADALGALPAVHAQAPFQVPVPETGKLSNGASLWVVPRPGLPLVSVVVSVPGGSATDVAGKEGTAALADRLLSQGAGDRDSQAFNEAVERLGISLDVSTGRSGSTVTMSMTKDKLDAALDLLADMVLRPRFAEADFTRERKLAVQDLQLELEEPVAVASRAAWTAWFGEDHPYGRAPEGTVKGLGAVSLAEAKAYHARAWNAAGAKFTVAGDVTRDEVQQELESRLGAAWKATAPATVALPPAPAHAGEVLLVNRPGSAQTMFYLAFAGLPFGDAGLPPVRVGTIVLGGTFTSRLNALLREKKGYTYGARANVQALPGAGILSITTRIRTDATGPAMTDLLGELLRIREGITDEELGKARGAYQQDLVETMESRGGVAGTYAAWHFAGKSPDALQAELTALRGVGSAAVPAAMSAFDVTKGVVVLVGDKKAIKKPLKAAGIKKIRVIDAE